MKQALVALLVRKTTAKRDSTRHTIAECSRLLSLVERLSEVLGGDRAEAMADATESFRELLSRIEARIGASYLPLLDLEADVRELLHMQTGEASEARSALTARRREIRKELAALDALVDQESGEISLARERRETVETRLAVARERLSATEARGPGLFVVAYPIWKARRKTTLERTAGEINTLEEELAKLGGSIRQRSEKLSKAEELRSHLGQGVFPRLSGLWQETCALSRRSAPPSPGLASSGLPNLSEFVERALLPQDQDLFTPICQKLRESLVALEAIRYCTDKFEEFQARQEWKEEFVGYRLDLLKVPLGQLSGRDRHDVSWSRVDVLRKKLADMSALADAQCDSLAHWARNYMRNRELVAKQPKFVNGLRERIHELRKKVVYLEKELRVKTASRELAHLPDPASTRLPVDAFAGAAEARERESVRRKCAGDPACQSGFGDSS